jgi:6-phosphogluconolactonase (cycloisomerase 2 family)
MKKQRLLVVLAFSSLLGIAILIGCTGGQGIGFLLPTGETGFQFFPPKFAFVFNGDGTDTISAFSVNASTGALTIVPGSPFATDISGCCTVFMDVDPNSRFLYVPNYDGNSVSVYSIGASGALTAIAGSPFATNGTSAFSARLHPNGRFLYVTNFNSDNITVFSVNNGALTLVGSPVTTGVSPHTAIMDWQGRFLYVTHASAYCCGSANDTIDAYAINSDTGALTPVPGSPFASGGLTPRGGMVDYSGKFLIVANRGNDGPDFGNIAVFTIGGNGALTPVAGSPFPSTNGPFNIAEAIVGGAAFIGSSNLDGGDVTVYALDTNTGHLTAVSGSPFNFSNSLSWPHYAVVDTAGKFGYIVDWGNDNIRVVDLNSSGSLTEISGSPFSDPSLSEPTQMIFSH